MTFNPIIMKDILLVVLGGVFGWTLGKLPDSVVFGVIAVAILLLLVVLKGGLK